MAASAWPLVTQRGPGVREPRPPRGKAKQSEINGQGRRTLTGRQCTAERSGVEARGQQEWDGRAWRERKAFGGIGGPVIPAARKGSDEIRSVAAEIRGENQQYSAATQRVLVSGSTYFGLETQKEGPKRGESRGAAASPNYPRTSVRNFPPHEPSPPSVHAALVRPGPEPEPEPERQLVLHYTATKTADDGLAVVVLSVLAPDEDPRGSRLKRAFLDPVSQPGFRHPSSGRGI